MKKYDVIIFDLDGTLVNTIADLGEAVNHALSQHGFPLHEAAEYPAMVGAGVRNLVKNALPASQRDNASTVESVLADFTAFYSSHIDVHTRPYPGMTGLLERLQADGSMLAVASNKFQSGTETLVREFFPERKFIAVCGNRPGMPLKPDAALVSSIMSEAGEGVSAVMVGDSATDILTAHNGGIPAIAVNWGYRPESDLKDADALARSPEELEELLRG